MRIIAGRFRSRTLVTPPDATTTRPIPDRVKESLFGLLRGHCEGAQVLDAFAGTGAIGLEALSRGAARVVFVERDRRAADILRRNIENLACEDECVVVVGDALGPAGLARCPNPVDLVFMDPPYPLVQDPEGWLRVRTQFARLIDLLTPTGFAMLRTPWPFRHQLHAESAPESPRPRRRRREREAQEHEWIGDEIDLDAIQAQTRELQQGSESDDDAEEAAPPAAPRENVDLTLPNAQGPETHVYANTAFHLYMRAKLQPPA